MKRKFLATMLALVILTPKPIQAVRERDILVYLNEVEIKFPDVKPFIEAGTTYVPLRIFSESFGYEVNYSRGNGKEYIEMIKGEDTLNFTIGEEEFFKNNLPIKEGSGKMMKRNERTVAPLRLVGEATGVRFHWSDQGSLGFIVAFTEDYIGNEEEVVGRLTGETPLPEPEDFPIRNYSKAVDYVNQIYKEMSLNRVGNRKYILYEGNKAMKPDIVIHNKELKRPVPSTQTFTIDVTPYEEGSMVPFTMEMMLEGKLFKFHFQIR